MTMTRRARLLGVLLLLVAVGLLLDHETGAIAQLQQHEETVDAELVDVVSGERVYTTKKTVSITRRARVAATIETTRIVGGGVADQPPTIGESARSSQTAEQLEQCRKGDAQCAQEPAEALPVPGQDDEDRASRSDQPMDRSTMQEMAVLDVATHHLQELQAHLREWLPKLQVIVAGVVDQITQFRDASVASWHVVTHECGVFYDHFVADTVGALRVLYRRVATVVADVYRVLRSYVVVVVDEVRVIWATHEEVRIVTRHVVSVVLLACLGGLFFSVYALAATVPDTVSAMWTSLDDLTRAQLKIVFVLVAAFAVYHLRALWSFWLLIASILTFYYWSGHVLAKTMAPHPSTSSLQRQASQARADKLKTQ